MGPQTPEPTMRFLSLLIIATACQLESFDVSYDDGKDPVALPDGFPYVTAPDPIDEQGLWIERSCQRESFDTETTWVVDLESVVTVPPPTYVGYHQYPDELWREPTGEAMTGDGDVILYSWSSAEDCIAWEWTPITEPATADTADTGVGTSDTDV